MPASSSASGRRGARAKQRARPAASAPAERPASPSSRPPLERMLQIHEALGRGGRENCSTLARRLEVSTKTIMRDIAFMRDRLGLPIEYQDSDYSYAYTSQVEAFPTVQVTEGEVFALMVARQAMEQYKGTAFEKTLATAFGKISSGLRESVSFTPAAAGVSFRSLGAGEADLGVFQLLHRCVSERVEVSFLYRKLGDAEAAPRTVEPLHLAFVQGAWYLIARDPGRGALRTFSLARLSGLKEGRRTFERPEDFDPERFFADSFGVFTGEGTREVRLRFDGLAARIVSERTWHSSQHLSALPDGAVELRFRVSDLTELCAWVLGWGVQVRVISPPELAERVRQSAAAVAALYSGSKAG